MLHDHRVTSGYYPQSNGLNERQIETIKEVLMWILITISTEQPNGHCTKTEAFH